jgi:hypothetical protein
MSPGLSEARQDPVGGSCWIVMPCLLRDADTVLPLASLE